MPDYTVIAERYRDATGLTRGELEALVAIYVLAGSLECGQTTSLVVETLLERVHGYHQNTVCGWIRSLVSKGLVHRSHKRMGSYLVQTTDRGTKRVRELRGDFERTAVAGAAE